MKKNIYAVQKALISACVLSSMLMISCSNQTNRSSSSASSSAASPTTDDTSSETESATPVALTSLKEQGNPLSIKLADIVEESSDGTWKAWVKVSTQYDPELSVYSYDLIPANTEGIIVEFTVSGMDTDSATLYWCYQLETADETISVWDTSSPADTLTITGDGTYTMVFDAEKALGAPISVVDSLQIVFPDLTETTTTTFTFTGAWATTDKSDLLLYTSDSDSSDSDSTDSDASTISDSITDTTLATTSRTITIAADSADFSESQVWDGLGFINANNSSRLLLDYKSENPEDYWQLMNYIFSDDGLGLNLIKIEMGADVDSSSGTEPAVKRSADEEADVTRGAGYQLVADALTINPDIKVDMLSWGTPAWVADSEDVYAATYAWYKETLDAAYDTYGIKFYSVTASKNERTNDTDWIKYLSNALKNETDSRYDYSKILIVAGEGVSEWTIADKMLADGDLLNAIDIVTSHYTSYTNDSVLTLKNEYGKKIWFSEGSSPMSEEAVTRLYDGTGTGLSDINGMLDIATRITQAVTSGMTMYEFQPVVAGYYSGVTYFPKQLILANEPWSGSYMLDSGFYMGMHFTKFFKEGWSIIDDACYGDGKAGGDGHAIVDSLYNYITAVSSDKKDCSTVLVNNSAQTIAYTIKYSGIDAEKVYVWESKAPASLTDASDSCYFRYRGALTPTSSDDGSREVTFVMQPYSMMSVSTLVVDELEYEDKDEDVLLELPYSDDFEYKDYDEDYLASRGMAPRYTTDQAGAFEVVSTGGGNVLMQKINYDNKAVEWGSSGSPSTNLGDDRWSDYTFSADVLFTSEKAESSKTNYVGIGIRYNLADSENSGYSLRLGEDGVLTLMNNKTTVATAEIGNLDTSVWHTLSLTAIDSTVTCSVDGDVLIEYENEAAANNSGRIALYSDYQNNCFDNLKVTAATDAYSIMRYDNLDPSIEYSEGSNNKDDEGWYFETMCSYKNYGRTLSTGSEGDSFTVTLEDSASYIAFIGKTKDAVITVKSGDTVIAENLTLPTSSERQASARVSLPEDTKTVTVTVISGTFCLDAIEY